MRKTVLVILVALAIVGIGFYVFIQVQTNKNSNVPKLQTTATPTIDTPETSIVAEGLDTPWAIAFLPDKSMLVTERPGRVRLIDSNGKLDPTPVATLPQVKEIGEGGLLGITTDPKFSSNQYAYLYYTYSSNGINTLNKVSRFTYKNTKLSDEKILVDKVPGSSNHNGGRIKFGPDGYLYITTGDAENPSQAQDKNSLAGKILRVTTEGKPAPGNPFGNRTYSYGHRNPQGLTWIPSTTTGLPTQLFETEHGPSGAPYGTGQDEFNRIDIGKNYGWPTIIGSQTKSGMETPLINSGVDTWAPGDVAYYLGNFFFGGLKGQALYETRIEGAARPKEFFKNQFGRIREVILGPDGMLYITTSNNDGRGTPNVGDDKVVKINPLKLD